VRDVGRRKGEGDYLLDNRQPEASQRFNALSRLFDETTFGHIRSLGIAAGWRVWEVGAGGPSVPSWLARQVGRSGRVIASDIDTSWIEGDSDTFHVVRHDVATEPPLSADHFDLVHARLVLVHLKDRIQALASMISSLCRGGWLILEEADPWLQPLACPDKTGPDEILANRLRDGFRSLMTERGVDLAFGRTLPRLMRAAGLDDVHASAFFPLGGAASDELERATVEQVRTRLIESGLATDDEVARHLANVMEGRLVLATPPLISSMGRKPQPSAS
jgi:SAM-dependent methyltransferase